MWTSYCAQDHGDGDDEHVSVAKAMRLMRKSGADARDGKRTWLLGISNSG